MTSGAIDSPITHNQLLVVNDAISKIPCTPGTNNTNTINSNDTAVANISILFVPKPTLKIDFLLERVLNACTNSLIPSTANAIVCAVIATVGSDNVSKWNPHPAPKEINVKAPTMIP